MKHKYVLLMTVNLIILSACTEKKPAIDPKATFITMQMNHNDNPLDVFIASNYYFYSKYSDPNYEPYGKEHWSSIETYRKDGLQTINRISTCSEDSLDNEHYNFFQSCILKQVNTIDAASEKTSTLILESKNEKARVDFEYDDKHRLAVIKDSASAKTYQFVYSDSELTEIHEIEMVAGVSTIKAVIGFQRK